MRTGRPPHRPLGLLLVAGLALASLGACGDATADLLASEGVGEAGKVVGGPCAADQDCEAGSSCLRSEDFPGGTCSRPCLGDDQCPAGTRCVEEDKGRCLVGCVVPADCRAGYSCRGKDHMGAEGDVLVCAGL